MAAALTISGVSASAYGFVLSSAPQWLDAPPRTFQTAPIPGHAGATPLSGASEGAKKLVLRGTIIGASAGDARAKLDGLKVLLAESPTTISLSDRPTRFCYADYESVTSTPSEGGSFLARKLPIEISLQCPGPMWYDSAFTSLVIPSGTTQLIPLGTGPVRPLLTVLGPSVNPVIALDSWLGDLYAEMIFNGLNLASGDNLAIDCEAVTISRNGQNAIGTLTVGDFFVIEAAKVANYRTAQWPRIGLTGGGSLSVAYRRTWR